MNYLTTNNFSSLDLLASNMAIKFVTKGVDVDELAHLNDAFELIRKKDTVRELLIELVSLTRKLHENPYPFDTDGKAEFEGDLAEAYNKASKALTEYVNGDLR